jgi:D-alanine-D-alanine ligase
VKDLPKKIAVLMGGPSSERDDPAIAGSAKHDRELLIEKFVSGRELTIGILGDQALPILEIIPKGGFDNFTNKYPFLNPQAGGGGGRVYGRVDVILSESGEPFVLEVNTIPGMTGASLLREAAAAAGIGYSDLCTRIIALSGARAEGSRR